MKKLDLNSYSVQEMNANEMEKTTGGIAVLVAILCVVLGFGAGALIAGDKTKEPQKN